MEYDQAKLGERIKNLRKGYGLTQAELAEELQISPDYMQKIERARRTCPPDILINTASLFNVSVDYILLGEDSEREKQRGRLRAIAGELAQIAESMR